MHKQFVELAFVASVFIGLSAAIAGPRDDISKEIHWQTVSNSAHIVPEDGAGRPFSSFNPPSVNERGFVLFRARSRGPEPPASGIFGRDMAAKGNGNLYRLAGRQAMVPDPNNTGAIFNEFPSFPRLGIKTRIAATRGNSRPVWAYETPDGETRLGTSAVYAAFDGVTFASVMTQLGMVPGFESHLVPGAGSETRFEQFPGSPAVTDEGFVVSKGNYTADGISGTGVFFVDLYAGDTPIELIANTSTEIPNVPRAIRGLTFGSTAPPSAARGKVVFVGLDNEEHPLYGGLYLAKIEPSPRLETLIGIGDAVPGVPGATFVRIGEGLSFDGRNVAFWGAWGEETRLLRLYCPTEGNKDRRHFCREEDPNTIPDGDKRFQEIPVPVNQGFFVIDTQTGKIRLVTTTGDSFDDFLYWKYTGHPPGTGDSHSDAEPPKWRSSAYIAISNPGNGAASSVAFLARSGEVDVTTGYYADYVDGIYLQRDSAKSNIETVVDSTMPASVLDVAAPAAAMIGELGLERDGFRGRYLAISASMGAEGSDVSHGDSGEDESTWAGIYLAKLPAWGARR